MTKTSAPSSGSAEEDAPLAPCSDHVRHDDDDVDFGLMVISQMATFAKDFGIAAVTIGGMAAVPLALSIDRFTNGSRVRSSAGSGPPRTREHDGRRLRLEAMACSCGS